MTIETRYFTSTSVTYKSITCKKLSTSNTVATGTVGLLNGVRVGVRVWLTDEDENEYAELTLTGAPEATAIYVEDGEYAVNWVNASTPCAPTDRIVVRFYMKTLLGAWALKQTFVTDPIGATNIDAATWTFNYELVKPTTTLSLSYGNSDPNDSRITGFTWSAAAGGQQLFTLINEEDY